MATILIRAWFTDQSFKSRLDDEVGRGAAVKALLEKLGMKLLNVYWSSTEACGVTLCEGDAANIPSIDPRPRQTYAAGTSAGTLNGIAPA